MHVWPLRAIALVVSAGSISARGAGPARAAGRAEKHPRAGERGAGQRAGPGNQHRRQCHPPGCRRMSAGMARMRGACAALAAVALASGLLAACGSSSADSRQSITLYSGQHEQTTDSLVAGFEKATGIHGQRAQRRRGHPRQRDRHRGVALARRRHLHRELAGPRVPPGQGPAAPRSTRPRWRAPQRSTTRPGRLGRGLGAGERAHLQPEPDRAQPAAHLGPRAGRPDVQGQAGDRPRRDRLPAHRHLGRAHLRQSGRADVAGGDQGQRREPHLSGQRDHRRRGQPRRGRVRVVNQYYWYRMRAEIGAAQHPLRRSPTSPHTTPAT